MGAVANSQSHSAAIFSPASARWSLLLPSVERFLASAHPISDAASARASAIVAAQHDACVSCVTAGIIFEALADCSAQPGSDVVMR